MGERKLTIYANVGPSTGDVEHDGHVRVFGSVTPGHTVRATGDVFVAREVRDAKIFAGGDIVVNGAAQGEDAELDAVGSIRVRQASDVRLFAGRDIEIAAAAERAELAAGRRILIGGAPGVLRGGVARAGVGLEAVRIESAAGAAAEIVVGLSPFRERREELESRLFFARAREQEARSRGETGPRAYRRRIADALSWRTLAEALERRIRQAETAEDFRQPPYLRVSGAGPVRARLTLGPIEDALRDVKEQWSGGFAIVLAGEEARVRPIEEKTCVG